MCVRNQIILFSYIVYFVALFKQKRNNCLNTFLYIDFYVKNHFLNYLRTKHCQQ